MKRTEISRFALAGMAGVLVLAPLAAAAAPPGGSGSAPQPNHPENRRIHRSTSGDVTLAQRGAPPAYAISGRVVDSSGRALRGVQIKMFANGILEDSGKSDLDGAFAMETNPLTTGDGSWVLWFESPDPERILDVGVVIGESRVAQDQGLFPPCVPRVTTIGGNATVEVVMMTPEERRQAIIDQNCME